MLTKVNKTLMKPLALLENKYIAGGVKLFLILYAALVFIAKLLKNPIVNLTIGFFNNLAMNAGNCGATNAAYKIKNNLTTPATYLFSNKASGFINLLFTFVNITIIIIYDIIYYYFFYFFYIFYNK